MQKIKLEISKFSSTRRYGAFDQVLDLLISQGNELATSYRWGSNPTGYFALLKKPLDFDLLEQSFEFPSCVVLDRRNGLLDYGLGTVTIESE